MKKRILNLNKRLRLSMLSSILLAVALLLTWQTVSLTAVNNQTIPLKQVDKSVLRILLWKLSLGIIK
jgi:hypothetical protein